VGLFSRPKHPDISGLESFEGRVMHTAEWDESYDLTDKRVAVIGTGSSGVQVVAPLARRVGSLCVFQRAGTWLAHVPNYELRIPEAEQWLLANVPYYTNWTRILQVYAFGDQRTHLLDIDPEWTGDDSVSEANARFRQSLIDYVMAKVGDRPDLVEKCIPRYPPLAKRLPKDNGWYDAVKRDHVELVVDPIEQVTPRGIRVVAGREYEFDLIVTATGFHVNRFLWPISFEGRDGITLDRAWERDGARAYLGITIPGFPNLFCMYGPNTNGKSGSPIVWGEMQARYILGCIRYLIQNRRRSLEVKQGVFERFNEYLDERLRSLIWMDPRQVSYYRNEFGRSATNGAWLNAEYWPWTRGAGGRRFHRRVNGFSR
jgi:4-hydroxyacetophenone monooxygenase